MEPLNAEEKKLLTAEEKAEHDLDDDTEYYWDRNGNIRYLKANKDRKANQMVRRLDMDSEMSRKIKVQGEKRKRQGARDKIRELIEEETEFTYEDAPISLVMAAEAAVTGSSADRKHFLSEARGVGKLADKSKDAAPQKIIVAMDKDVREAMIRALEIIRDFRQSGVAEADSGNSSL